MAWTDEQRQIVITNSQLMDLDELAALTGKSRRTIYQYLYRNSIGFKQKIGGRSRRHSDKVVEEIRVMAKEGKKLRDISKMTGVSIGYISCLLQGLDRRSKTNNAKVEQIELKQCCANLLNSVFKD